VERMVWAWIMTLPVCGLFGYLFFELSRLF
jgi:phosphate/sulfate permease